MGMFDEVAVPAALMPEGGEGEVILQTKEFDCSMDRHRITPEGRLILVDTHLDLVLEEERPYWGKSEWKDPFWQACGSLRRVKDGEHDSGFHGDVKMIGGPVTCREYVARFTHGQLEYIKAVDDGGDPC
jgi:hypothetical protein